jgi:hypothetical protein
MGAVRHRQPCPHPTTPPTLPRPAHIPSGPTSLRTPHSLLLLVRGVGPGCATATAGVGPRGGSSEARAPVLGSSSPRPSSLMGLPPSSTPVGCLKPQPCKDSSNSRYWQSCEEFCWTSRTFTGEVGGGGAVRRAVSGDKEAGGDGIATGGGGHARVPGAMVVLQRMVNTAVRGNWVPVSGFHGHQNGFSSLLRTTGVQNETPPVPPPATHSSTPPPSPSIGLIPMLMPTWRTRTHNSARTNRTYRGAWPI